MKALVLGGASCVWDDVAETEALFGPDWWDLVVAANDIACHWPRPLDSWCTLHPDKLVAWKKTRAENGYPPAKEHVARHGRNGPAIDRTFRHPFRNGSSGLLAAARAMDLGATRNICCGIPMTKTGYFAGSQVHQKGKVFASADTHWKEWQRHADRLDGIVKSMSGRTRELLGPPTREWLEEAA